MTGHTALWLMHSESQKYIATCPFRLRKQIQWFCWSYNSLFFQKLHQHVTSATGFRTSHRTE